MARRRRHKKNPMGEEIVVLAIGAVGGGLAVALYMNAIAKAAAAKPAPGTTTTTLTTATPPALPALTTATG